MKSVKTILTLGLLTVTATAMAQNALNDVRLSPQGVNLALVGQATLVVPNDHARVLWTASAQANTLKEATAQAISQMNVGIEALKTVSHGVNLKTMNVNSYPVYAETTKGSGPQVVAWRVSQSLALETDKVEQVSQFIGAIDGRLELDNITFSVSESTREANQQELIRLAIDDATKKAAFSAQALGLKANRVQLKDLVFEGADSVSTNRVLMRASAKDDYATMPTASIESGTTTLTLSVKANALVR